MELLRHSASKGPTPDHQCLCRYDAERAACAEGQAAWPCRIATIAFRDERNAPVADGATSSGWVQARPPGSASRAASFGPSQSARQMTASTHSTDSSQAPDTARGSAADRPPLARAGGLTRGAVIGATAVV